MKTILALLVSVLLSTSFGCAMCDSPHLCKYASYGGVHERLDMVNGRVGSILGPAASINHSSGSSGDVATVDEIGEGTPTPAEADSPSDRDDSSSDDDTRDLENEANRSLLDDLDPGDGDSPRIPEMEDLEGVPSADDLFGGLGEDET